MSRILMIPTYMDGTGGLNTASARIRAHWVAEHWEDCDLYDATQPIPDYDMVIFQKCYYLPKWREVAYRLRQRDKVLAFDLCDPVWQQGGRGALREMLPLMDFAVASTEPIREFLGRTVPAYTIGDYMDLDFHTPYRQYGPDDVLSEYPTACWYGYSANFQAVEEFMPALRCYQIPLTVIADKPYPHPDVRFREWSLETVNLDILDHDIVINPPASAPRWRYKSDNKTKKAYALGVPCACNEDQLGVLLSATNRRMMNAMLVAKRKEVSVERAVEKWQALLEGGANEKAE